MPCSQNTIVKCYSIRNIAYFNIILWTISERKMEQGRWICFDPLVDSELKRTKKRTCVMLVKNHQPIGSGWSKASSMSDALSRKYRSTKSRSVPRMVHDPSPYPHIGSRETIHHLTGLYSLRTIAMWYGARAWKCITRVRLNRENIWCNTLRVRCHQVS